MAFLLLLHEKMRLQRKQNKLTLKQLRNGNMLSRMQSKIDKREKYYSKLEKKLETQANWYKNSAKNYINNICGVSTNSWNPNSIFTTGTVGMNQKTIAFIQQECAKEKIDPSLVELYLSGGQYAFQPAYEKDADGKATSTQKKDSEGNLIYTYGAEKKEISAKTLSTITQIANNSRYISQQNSQMASQWNIDYDNNINDWLQAQRDELDAQKEWEMDLLAEEQADYEAEKTSIEAELELVKQRKEAIEQELSQSIKDAAPKFGLG